MKKVRRASERAHIQHGWLETYHTFSFGNYFDPAHMGFKSLRVINEDIVDEGMGFEPHPHRNMEIITVMLEGSLAHKDSMGNEMTIKAGEIQVMSAGSGVVHSEFNPDAKLKAHLFQIWILPDQKAIQPRYEQTSYRGRLSESNLIKLLSPEAKDGAIKVYQQVNLYMGRLNTGEQLKLPSTNSGWIQLMKGNVKVDEVVLEGSDALAFEDEGQLQINALGPSEFLWFEFL